MSIFKIVIPLTFLYFVSTKGFPSHGKTEKHYLKSIEPGSNHYLKDGVHLSPVTATEGHPPSVKILQDDPSARMIIEDELPRTMLVDCEQQRKLGVVCDPSKTTTLMELDPFRQIPDDEPLPSPSTRTRTTILSDSPRDKRAVIWRAPPIRIPSITRLIRPSRVGSSSAPKGGTKPGSFNSGSSPTVNSKPFSKEESKIGPFGSKSGSKSVFPQEDSKSRPKGGSKSNSFPDFGDFPSSDGWSFPEFSGADPAVGSVTEGESNLKEDDGSNKTTTERNKQKTGHHGDYGDHFPDYDYHGWHHW